MSSWVTRSQPVRNAMDKAGVLVADDDQRLQVDRLYREWEAGAYVEGDIRNADGQTWECFAAHDNAVYPDIRPGNSAWYTFWRALHGRSIETARPFVPVQGSHDMYKAGEYAIWYGGIYMANRDTSYSPADWAEAWDFIKEIE